MRRRFRATSGGRAHRGCRCRSRSRRRRGEARLAGVRHGAGGQRHAHRPHIRVDPLGDGATASRSSPRSAAAPAIFSTSTVPPTPRRPACTASPPRRRRRSPGPNVRGCRRLLPVRRPSRSSGHRRCSSSRYEHAGASVDRLGRGQDLVGRRRGEHCAGDCGVEHAEPHEPGVQRLVAAAAAGNQADFARYRAPSRTTWIGSN